MSAQWNMIRESLSAYLDSQAAARAFVRAREDATELRGFQSPAVVVEFLGSGAGSFEAHDAVVASLVRLAQAGTEQQLAHALLWLGLWRALCAIHRRRRRCFDCQAELASSLAAIFHDQVGRLDLARVNVVIPTLLRNTERDLVRERSRAWRDRGRQVDVDLDTAWVRSGHASWLAEHAVIDGKRAWYVMQRTPDRALVLAVVVGDEPASEAAIAFGISHEAARKRVQRSLGRLRRELDDSGRVPA
jgi:hypothetical protein